MGGVGVQPTFGVYVEYGDECAVAAFPKGNYTRNQFGFAIGGPIIKDKLFFFASTEWIRVRGNASNQSLIPTPHFLAASAPNTQAFFHAFGPNPPSYSQTITKRTNLRGCSDCRGAIRLSFRTARQYWGRELFGSGECWRRQSTEHLVPVGARGLQDVGQDADVMAALPSTTRSMSRELCSTRHTRSLT